MAFRGAFGVSATPQRTAPGPPGGNALPSPSAYTRSSGSFPFGGGVLSPTALSPNHANPTQEPNLDPSDFPALSGGSQAPSQQSSLLSSYASTATPLGPLSPATTLPSIATALLPIPSRDFSQDDFPALGGFAAPPQDALAPPNGMSRATSSEQASAAAALQQQAQLQHRANLLGSMNGNPVRRIIRSPVVLALVFACATTTEN